MSPIAAGIGGLLIGLAIGWFVGHSARGSATTPPELKARQKSLEEEHQRLARELSAERDRSQADISNANEVAQSTAMENRKLLRRIRDLESALTTANAKADDTPVSGLEMQLAMAERERDAAQKALMELEARNAIERSRPAPGEDEPDDFPALPELEDTDETEEKPKPPPAADDDDPNLTLVPAESIPPVESSEPPDDPPAPADPPGSVPDTPFPSGFAAESTLMPEAFDSDDLTKLTGIGPATAEKLKQLGYDSYAALAALDDDGVAELERKLGSRRASRDDWRGQAAALVSSAQEE